MIKKYGKPTKYLGDDLVGLLEGSIPENTNVNISDLAHHIMDIVEDHVRGATQEAMERSNLEDDLVDLL